MAARLASIAQQLVGLWELLPTSARLLWLLPLAASAALVMGEISGLLATLTSTGFSYSAHAFTGWPGTPWDDTSRQSAFAAWDAWTKAVPALTEVREDALEAWLMTHILLDLVIFAPAYVIGLYLLTHRLLALRAAQEGSDVVPFGPRGIAVLASGLLSADWAETALTIGLVYGDPDDIAALASVVTWLSALKWLLVATVLLLVTTVFVVDVLPQVLRSWLGNWLAGTSTASRCWTRHRVQLITLIVLAALIVLPGGGPLEQVPDIQRAWVDTQVHDGWWASAKGYVGDMAGPVLTLTGLCVALWVAGRWALLDGLEGTRREARTRLRFLVLTLCVFAVVLVVLAVGPVWSDGPWRWQGARNAGALAIPVVMTVALLLSAFATSPVPQQPVRPPADRVKTETIGRALTVVPLVIAGLGLVRAFTKPVLVQPVVETGVSTRALWTWFAVGMALALLVPPLCYWLLEKAETKLCPTPTVPLAYEPRLRQIPRRVATVLLAVVCALGVATAWDPLFWGARLRTLGALSLGLTTVVLLAALFIRHTEKREPYRAFSVLRFRFTPIWLPAVAVLATQSMLDNSGLYHAVQLQKTDQRPQAAVPTGQSSSQQPFAQQRFAAWYQQAAKCWQVKKGEAIPMVLVAAAGGGIRAAYWTSTAMDRLADSSPCAPSSVFALSGVSGGSLGLAAYTLTSGTTETSSDKVRDLADEDALAADIAALLYRDGTHAFHGLNDVFGRTVGDRAAVFESAWEADWDGWKRELTSATARTEQWRPFLLMNGTDVVTGCRVAVAAQPLTGKVQSDERLRCQKPTIAANGDQLATATVDASAFNDPQDCRAEDLDQGLRMSTAAHLSARFTYISPSGTMYGCAHGGQNDPPAISTIDGGYLEASGMAGLLELWSAVEPEVAAHNRCVTARLDAEAADSERRPTACPQDEKAAYVVPLAVLLDNHYSVQTPDPDVDPVNELVAPLVGNRAHTTAARLATLQQAALVRFTGPVPGTTRPAASPVRSFLVAPRTEPQVAAPLGWVLSEMSMHSMRRQLDPKAARSLVEPTEGRLVARRFNDLIDTLKRPVQLRTDTATPGSDAQEAD
nr:hypothetical protein SBE_006422 [Streptomyces sp. SBE_14.2]